MPALSISTSYLDTSVLKSFFDIFTYPIFVTEFSMPHLTVNHSINLLNLHSESSQFTC